MSATLQTAIGVISGTSMDAIDVALVKTDGVMAVETGAVRSYPYHPLLREELLRVVADPYRGEFQPLTELEEAVTDAHVSAVAKFMAEEGLRPAQIDLIGLHGQTVFHAPKRKFTRQLGLGVRAAKNLGINVVYRFRHADIAAGGEGAPIVPLYHRALAAKLAKPLMVLNLGGVGNVTFLNGDTVIAFDTGPASALIDDFMRKRLEKAFDEDGALAASGAVHVEILKQLLDDPYFTQAAPKSLDRNHFHAKADLVKDLSDEDGAATLAAFTVEATIRALEHVPEAPLRWLVTGGGRLNKTFMALFAARLGVPVEPVESVGWNGDGLEAQCFGYLAVRSRMGLPLSLPTTTGVEEPCKGGELALASK